MEAEIDGQILFPISRDPPEGGTILPTIALAVLHAMFPISRDPPEGGTVRNRVIKRFLQDIVSNF